MLSCLSSWCRLFYEELQFLLQQNSPTTWCCHLRASQLVCYSQLYKRPPFSSKCIFGHYGQTGHVSRSYGLCLGVFLQTNLAFLCFFRSNGFFLTERPFRPWRGRTLHSGQWHFLTSFIPICGQIWKGVCEWGAQLTWHCFFLHQNSSRVLSEACGKLPKTFDPSPAVQRQCY